MAIVGREALNKATFKRAVVHVPEWGGDVHIRELSAAEVASVQKIATSAVDLTTRTVTDTTALARFQAAVIVAGGGDENGAHVLTDADIDTVLAQPSQIVVRLAQEISRLSGMEQEENADPVTSAKNA